MTDFINSGTANQQKDWKGPYLYHIANGSKTDQKATWSH